MTYRIGRKFHFSASHQLEHLPDGHKCRRLHGHNYTVELIFCSPQLGSDFFVRDFDSLGGFEGWLEHTLDHRHLNDVLKELHNPHTQPRGAKPLDGGMDQRVPLAPTSENLACFIYQVWSLVYLDLQAVRVSEGNETWAEYTEGSV
jgi:6-pyruvoyltetrahydropterin/6-carboxytetrahydropterin synthase